MSKQALITKAGPDVRVLHFEAFSYPDGHPCLPDQRYLEWYEMLPALGATGLARRNAANEDGPVTEDGVHSGLDRSANKVLGVPAERDGRIGQPTYATFTLLAGIGHIEPELSVTHGAKLTDNMLTATAYTAMGLSAKETAGLMGKTPKAVYGLTAKAKERHDVLHAPSEALGLACLLSGALKLSGESKELLPL